MGDHRSASADSREHMSDKYSGTIGVSDVIGKAAMIVWPVSRFGFLAPDIQGEGAEGAVDAAGALLAGRPPAYRAGRRPSCGAGRQLRRRRRNRHRRSDHSLRYSV